MNVYDAVSGFYRRYRGKKLIYGKSAEGRNLYAMYTGGRGAPVGICQYAIHAREWICALLALEHLNRGVPRGGVWILPLTNPDGALLCTEGAESVRRERREALIGLNGGEDFSLWKANAEAVDLNVNFDARWGTGRSNSVIPAPENYVGEEPFCAPESAALRDFTLKINPDYTVSWHTKGEEIYWRFHQTGERLKRDFRLACVLSAATGYPLKEARFSAGGYKDWCVEKLKIPAFTVEAGSDSLSHPLDFSALPDLLKNNLDAVARLAEEF
ncbi:MAG: hypothetical protein HFE26_03685 [Clostridia bacterium]|nr:hypothetical protein [Clostridia bacterium]